MAMRIGVCVSLNHISRPVAGLDFLEGSVAEVLCPLESQDVFAERLAAARALPLPMEAVNRLFPANLKTTGPEVDRQALDEYIATACRRAEQIGIKVVVFGAGASRKVPEGFERRAAWNQLADHLKRWGPMAQRAGLVIAIEPLHRNESNIINSVSEAAELARQVDQDGIRILADTYHMGKENEGLDGILAAGAGLIRHVHCADPAGRVPLGFGPADHRPYFRALKDIGYDARVCIEAVWQDLPAQVTPAAAALRRQIDSA
jgi:sugar phosphate isomerase/epimerase